MGILRNRMQHSRLIRSALLCLLVAAAPAWSQTKAAAAPGHAQAAAIFTEAWKKHRPDFDVHLVEVLKSEPKQYQDRRWITYKLAITATGTDKGSRAMYEKKYRCTPADHSSVLKWDDAAKAWLADDGMIRNINESVDCKPAP